MKKVLFHSVVPHDHNDYTPSLLQRFAMGGMALLVVLSFTATNIQALLWQSSNWLVGSVLPSVITTSTNKERESYNVVPLTRSAILDEAARLKAEHMAAEGYFAHYSPGGISPWYWFDRAGYTYVHAGENLAVHFSDSEEIVEAWMNSPTHRANIVNANYTEIGIGVAKGTYEGYDTVFVVQLFGTPGLPAVTASAPEVAPAAPVTVVEAEEIVVETETATEVLGVADDHEYDSMIVSREIIPPTTENDAVDTQEIAMIAEPEGSEPYVAPEDHISTSTDLMVAPGTLLSQSGGTTAPMMAQLATQPNSVLQMVYLAVGGVTSFLLLLSIVLGWRRRKITQVWYGVGLLGLISVLFFIHLYVTGGAIIA